MPIVLPHMPRTTEAGQRAEDADEDQGRLRAHKELFCRQFIETHELYDPATLPWPELDEAQLGRLRSVPFWQEVYHTERRAGAIVAAFTPTVQDPIVREAVALEGVEETRHADLIRVMIDRYGLDATEQPMEKLPDEHRDGVHRLRLRRMHGQLPRLRRVQDGASVGIPARGDVRDLRRADVRGDAPHRVLHQLHGVARGAARAWLRRRCGR